MSLYHDHSIAMYQTRPCTCACIGDARVTRVGPWLNSTQILRHTTHVSKVRPMRTCAHGHDGIGHGNGHAPTATTETTSSGEESEPKFLDELRQYAMALHTKEQAPGSGKAASPPPSERKAFAPTKTGVLRFLEESKVVYDEFERIIESDESGRYACLRNTGLERGAALAEDIDYMVDTWGLRASARQVDGPGSMYAAKIRDLAENNPPAFICHYYNFYFAHTAGGRMIGKQVSEAVLDGWMGAFYRWDGNVSVLLNGVRDSLNEMGSGWSEEEKRASMEETPETFKMAGSLMRLMATEE